MDRHALICGASAGIGRAAALQLASQGNVVTLLARNHEALDEAAKKCEAAGAPATHVLALDLDNLDAVELAIQAHIEAAGPIHILINNTGGPPHGPLIEAKDDDFLPHYRRHLLAAQRLTQLVLPGMSEAGWGRIVNVLSISVREPIPGLGVSNTIRHGMAAWAKTLSRELPPNVTINSVLPGYTDTERLAELRDSIVAQTGKSADEVVAGWVEDTPERRLGRPDEVGAAIAWLGSDDASFVRGVVLPVDGGRLHTI